MVVTQLAAGEPAAASSDDGRSFSVTAPAKARLAAGAIVAIDASGCTVLAQVHHVERSQDARISGSGKVLGAVALDGSFHTTTADPFTGAPLTNASRDLVELLHGSHRATLAVGTLQNTDAFEARLLSHRFNRHTFWCGQSGSGKTYALGVVLEELLLRTALPIVIFDPNADFVSLREPADTADAAASATLGSRDIRVLRPGVSAQHPLRARFSTMSTAAKAATLRLDPLIDRAEYNNLLHLENVIGHTEPGEIIARLRDAATPGSAELAMRIENLRLGNWSVWARHDRAASEIIDDRPDATVLDLGGFDFPDEALVVALSVLDSLWERRDTRRPALLVIDEAHNLCSPENDSPLHRAVRERLTQIAAEGRKFGLWLLLSTQRPSKIDANILSQCDNLALMKMSSPGDLDELARIFGYVPRELLDASPLLGQGEALFAGGFTPAPALVRMRRRHTREGGGDVGVPLR